MRLTSGCLRLTEGFGSHPAFGPRRFAAQRVFLPRWILPDHQASGLKQSAVRQGLSARWIRLAIRLLSRSRLLPRGLSPDGFC